MSLSDVKITWLGTAVVALIAAALAVFITLACTPEPKTETVVQTRTDTIPGPSDTVKVAYQLPPRPFVERIEVPTTDSVMGQWLEYLWVQADRLQARIDSLEGITAVAITETPTATLTAHLNMPLFLKDPKQGLWAEGVIRTTDTTRTNTTDCSLTFWRRFGLGIGAGIQYDVTNNVAGAGISAGVQFRIY